MQRQPIRAGRVLLCIELCHDVTADGSVQLVTSIPGREGTLTHRWRAHSGRLNDHQLSDVQLRLCQVVLDALLASGSGVQQTLA